MAEGFTSTYLLDVGELVPAPAPLQGHLRGVVTDWMTGRPILDAAVSLPGLDRAVLSDAEGRFRMSGVAPGVHVIRIERLGYEPLVDSVPINSGEALELDISLFGQAFELEGIDVEVRSDLTEETRRSGFARTTVAPARIAELREEVSDLEGVLRRTARGSVQVVHSTRRGVGSDLCITVSRGGTPTPSGLDEIVAEADPGMLGGRGVRLDIDCPQALVMVDGIVVTDALTPLSGGGSAIARSILRFPVEELRSIRVLGPLEARSRYGTRGAFGAILVTTR